MRYWDHDFGWGWFGALMMIVTMLVFWGGLVTIVLVLLRRSGHAGGGAPGGAEREADRILDERFARGEIDVEELQRRRAALRHTD